MVLVDTSVWIDYLGGRQTGPVANLRNALAHREPVALTDLIYLEILQGVRDNRAFRRIERSLGRQIFLGPLHKLRTYADAARLYRRCREAGITPRSTLDCLIAILAIEHRARLLHDDRDYEQIARAEPKLGRLLVPRAVG
jgi:predicted nucleic acid-binding protein